MTKEERARRIIYSFSGDWKNIPMDKVMEFVMEMLESEGRLGK